MNYKSIYILYIILPPIEGESKVDREFEAEFGRDWVDGCWDGGTGKAVKW